MKVRPIIIGAVIGAIAGFLMAGGHKGAGSTAQADYGKSPQTVTGKFAVPFQWGTDKG